MANIPRARYDGGVYFIRSFLSNRLADLGRFVTTFSAASATGYVQADLDSPYPRAPNGSVTTAWTRYGADGSVMDGMNGNGAAGRRRLREGRV